MIRRSIPAAAGLCLCFAIAACARPAVVREGADLAGARLADIKANAAYQQQMAIRQRESISRGIVDAEPTIRDTERSSGETAMVWRMRGSGTDAANLRLLDELKANDGSLRADPYVLVRTPPPPVAAMTVIDSSGLDSAMTGVGRLAGEAFTTKDAASFGFDVLQKIELPKQPPGS
jgi:hypothetical protein